MDDMIRIELAGGLVIAPSWDAIAKLHAKVADLGKRVGHMEKDGKNDFHKYLYISYEQAAAAIRSALPEIGLSLSVGVAEMQNWDTTRNNKGVERRLVTLEATLTDTETGAMRVIRWYGEGEDQNDKATAKAITSGVKYLLMRNLSISSEDDVEPDAEDGKPTKAPAQRQARPTPSGNGHSSAPTPQPKAEPSATAMAPQQAEPSKPKPVRPYEPETVRQGVQAIAADGAKVKADEGYRGLCVGVLDGLFANDDKNMRTAKRHALSTYLLGKGSSNEWTAGEVVALLKWACNGGDPSNVNENAPIEAERIVRQYEAEHGQQALGV